MRFAFRDENSPAVESEAAFVARCEPWMRERLSGSAWCCWVAEGPAGIVGHLWLQLIEKIPNPAPELEQHAYITNVYVEPASRGAGIGALLLAAALSFCRDERVDSVILWPTERSRPLYARHGFVEPDDLLELVLGRGPRPPLNQARGVG